MERLLIVDQGNTLVKMILFEDGRPAETFRRQSEDQEALLSVAAEWNCTAGIYSGVGKINERFVESLRRLVRDELLVFTPRTPLPITNAYATPETLGSDRLAAAVGGASLFPGRPLLIVDAGTAITADTVDGAGTFLGGAISPGVRMRLAAMSAMTARLPMVEPTAAAPLVGRTTAESLLNGAVNGAVLEIAGRAAMMQVPKPLILLTGGDAPLIADVMRSLPGMPEVSVEPDLVPLGLFEIFKFNTGQR